MKQRRAQSVRKEKHLTDILYNFSHEEQVVLRFLSF